MQELLNIMLDSGRTGVELSLYIILPIMVIMMAIMHVLDKKNILNWVAKGFSPLLILFGLPGLGVFAIVQILFISFAAPVSTLKIMEHDKSISDAGIAATLAAILVMAQANAVFPLAAVGLNVPVGIATSLIGGLIASFIAFKLSGGHTSIKASSHEHIESKESIESIEPTGSTEPAEPTEPTEPAEPISHQVKTKKLVPLLFEGGEAGLAIVLKSIPPLIIAIFMVNLFKRYGVIDFLEIILSPALTLIGIPTVAVLPIVTKFIAGGTAMMAIILDLMKEGAMSVTDLNRIAGFTLNPLDPVGLAVLMATGSRVTKVAKPAIIGAIIGIVIRGILHLIIF